MKFLHAADIHLDSPLAGLRDRGVPSEVIDGCTRRAFAGMIDLARREDVAFVVIAGDLYDGDWRDFSTGLFFAEQMQRLGRPCFLLRGNHDAASVITRNLRLPTNVREFSSRRCETFDRPDLGVALHGRSFPNQAVPEDLSASYPAPVRGRLNIGVLHTSAEDPGEHETYAPCSVASLALRGYDYWALGHIHQRRVLHERPWIVFPGNLQGRHAKETGAKGCTLVTVEDGRIATVAHHTLDVLRWASMSVAVGSSPGVVVPGLLDSVAAAAREAVTGAEGRPVLARVTLSGQTDLHARLLAGTDDVAAECRNAALAAGGQLWVERVLVRTQPVSAEARDLLAPLRAAFLQGLDDPALVADLLEHLRSSVRQKLPQAIRDEVAVPDDAAALAMLAEDAWQVAMAAIEAAGAA